MRIISGDYKGRRLYTPEDRRIRPTSDKVKEALFSILGESVIGAYVCDLFSGTGNLGIEALSRGADKCYFCDNSASAVRLIKKNVDMCRAGDHSEIIHGDYKRALSYIASAGDSIDIFLLDPPYDKKLWESAMEMIRDTCLLSRGGLIVCEHYKEIGLAEAMAGYNVIKERCYGKVVLSIYM